MPYRKRFKGSRKFSGVMARARAIKERKRLESPAPDYSPDLPMIRRRIVIEDYDSGQVVRHEFVLGRCSRIDCYEVSVDGQRLGQMGWSRAITLARKAFVRCGRFD